MEHPVGINTQVRDFNFTFKDSCNCFCARPRLSTSVRITQEMEVVPFFFSRGVEHDIQSIQNIITFLDKAAEATTFTSDQLRHLVEQKINQPIQAALLKKLTLGLVLKINQAVQEILTTHAPTDL